MTSASAAQLKADIGSESDASDMDDVALDVSTVQPLTPKGRITLQLILAPPQDTVAIRNKTGIKSDDYTVVGSGNITRATHV